MTIRTLGRWWLGVAAIAMGAACSTASVSVGNPGQVTVALSQAAIDACANLAEGDACSFITDDGETRGGTCKTAAWHDNAVACMPEGMGGDWLAAAQAACASLAAGDACSMTTPSGETFEGVCHQGWVASGELLCAHFPTHLTPPQALIDACAGLNAGDACSFAAHDGDTQDGTCGPSWDGTGTLVCLRDHFGGHGPSQGMVDACAGLADGAACSISMPDGDSVEGACGPSRHDAAVLVCRFELFGDGDDDQPGGGLLQPFVDACASAVEGDACTVTLLGGASLSGVCLASFLDPAVLVCRVQFSDPDDPDDNGGPGQPDPGQAALDACVALAETDACSFSAAGVPETGTCQLDQADQLVCVPD